VSLIRVHECQVTPPPKAAGMIRRVFDLLEESPVFSEYAKYTASDRSSKIISAKELPIPENGTLDFVIKYYDEDEDKPSANAPTHVLSLSFTTTHDTSNLNQSDHSISCVLLVFSFKHRICSFPDIFRPIHPFETTKLLQSYQLSN
jgi:hypothetical protein